MICPYCDVEMDAVGMTLGNGWECAKCGHCAPEPASWKMTGIGCEALAEWYCACANCRGEGL